MYVYELHVSVIQLIFMFFLVFFSIFVDCRRKKKRVANESGDEPIETAPEYGKVWHPDSKKWGHYIGRSPHALVAFVNDDSFGRELSAIMEKLLNMVDISKINLVVAETRKIPDIIEDQGIRTFPSIKFYKSGMKSWSESFEGYPSARSLANWVNKIINELDDWNNEEI